jgi:hypothetical protein
MSVKPFLLLFVPLLFWTRHRMAAIKAGATAIGCLLAGFIVLDAAIRLIRRAVLGEL